MLSRTKIAALCAAAALAMPAVGFAQTTDVQSQVQTLLNQIKALQLQLKTLLASSTVSTKTHEDVATSTAQGDDNRGPKPCVQILHELKKGSHGDEVSTLQKFLQSDSSAGFTGSITGFFGQLTAAALAKFEAHEGIASTTPGVLATSTRDHLSKPCPPQNQGSDKNATGVHPASGDVNGDGADQRPRPPVNNDHNNATSTNPLPPVGDDHGRPNTGALIRGATLVTGTVTANSGTSITIRTYDGLKTVLVGLATVVSSTSASSTVPTPITVAGITVGIKARAIGTANTDGTITATAVQIGDLRPINF